jgi:hypothetical protein
MSIKTETSKRTGIPNHQDPEISTFHLNWSKQLDKKHPMANRRTEPSAVYNCHGLTFASRRTRIEKSTAIQMILKDDIYKELSMKEVKPGDVVIYYSDAGDPSHSGIVVEAGKDLVVPIICSKWGNAGEFVHGLSDCPPLYGTKYRFFRCTL